MQHLLKAVTIAGLTAITLQSFAQQASSPVLVTGSGNSAFNAGNSDAVLASLQPPMPNTNSVGKANLLKPVNKASNLTSLSAIGTNKNAEVVANNKGYENDPELGILYANAPCSNCYELLDKRTETQKYFVKEGTGTKEFLLQSSNVPVHYKDAQGKWRTITDRLEKKANGIYSTAGRPVNIEVHTGEGYLTLVANGGSLAYNRNLELVLQNADGSETSLGKANWTNYTVGDDGMRISNVWPGIDMEIGVLINSVKTNFVINTPMPACSGGKLLIRDHMAPGKGLSFEQAYLRSYTGELSFKNGIGQDVYKIQKATAYEKDNAQETVTDLAYGIGSGNIIDIEIPGAMLNKTAGHYPLIIDPLVSGTVSSAFSYSTFIETNYCSNTNSMTIPAAANLSDIQMTYTYRGIVGPYWHNSETRYSINGGCSTGWFYCSGSPTGLGASGAACGLSGASFWSGGSSSGYPSWGTTPGCVPSFSCSPYTLSFRIDGTQDYVNHGSCESSVFATATGFTVVVSGSIALASITPSFAPVCVGATATLSGSPSGGSWSTSAPGVVSVNSSGTIYALSAGSATITYTPGGGYCPATAVVTSEVPLAVASLTLGAADICIGSTTAVVPAIGGGTWSSSAPSVATVDASGNVYAVAPGTAQISQVRTNTCSSVTDTVTVTVHSLPSPGTLSGPMVLCIPGSSTGTLVSSVSGGTWTISDPSIATIIGSSGWIVANAFGVASVSYTVSDTYCSAQADAVITVSPAPAVSPITTQHFLCIGSTIYLSDTAWNGTWSTSGSTIASLTSTDYPITSLIGLSAGTINVMYSFTNLCGTATDTASITVQPIYSDRNIINTIAGNGTATIAGDGGPALSATIAGCDGIAMDRAGNIYYSDNEYMGWIQKRVVRKISNTGIISLFAGNYTTTGSFGDGGPAIGAGLLAPDGVAVDSIGNVYIADRNDNKIRKVDISGTISTYATVYSPGQMCTDRQGNLYVVSNLDHVYKINTSGISTLYGGGGSSMADGVPATDADFSWLKGVAVDPDGNVYVSLFNPYWYTAYIRKIDAGGNMSTIVHCYDGTLGISPAVGYGGDGGPSIAASLNYFGPLTCDNAYNLYISADGRIRKINLRTMIITTFAGNGGSSAGVVTEGVPARASSIIPMSMTTDSAGNVYLGDYYYRIRKISNYLQSQMTGSSTVCLGSTSTLIDSVTGFTGTWLNSNPAVATRSATGVITPLAIGTTTFTYRVVNDCDSQFATKTITVVNPPTAGTISGADTVCKTGTITLVPSVSGGSWSSTTGFTSVSASGVVTGVNVGVDSIAYTVSNAGCSATTKYGITIKDCSEVGIASNIANSTNVNLFPNPSRGGFTVFISSANNSNGKVIVRNMLDQQVGEFDVTTNTANKISLNVAPGIYYVTVLIDKVQYVRKVVIER